MPITNNIQLIDSQRKSLPAQKSADVIQEMIRQKRVTEANLLFQKSASGMEKDVREKISNQLSALVEQAEKYFHEADTLETERKLEQARAKYKKVEDIAIDYPELPEALRRLDDTIALIQALEHRAKRRMSRQDKQSAVLTTSSQSGRLRGWLPLLTCFSLLLIMVGAGLFYTDNLNLTFTKKDPVPEGAPLEEDKFSKAKNSVSLPINSKIEQPEAQKKEKAETTALKQQTQKNTLSKEEAGQQQDNRKESLSPVPVSLVQMEKKIEDTDSVARESTLRQEIQPTADIVRKSEETIPEKSTPQLQDYVANRLTVDESKQPKQIRSEIKQQDKSTVEISSNREDSAESVYTVQPGDTLGLVSLKVYGRFSKWPAIANANKDQLAHNPDGLQVGMTLAIPPLSEAGNVLLSQGSSTSLPDLNDDGTYTVQSGDSLSIIAQKLFGNVLMWRKIYELNNDVLTAPHILKVGQILRVKASGPVKETINASEAKEKYPGVPTFGPGPSDYFDSQ